MYFTGSGATQGVSDGTDTSDCVSLSSDSVTLIPGCTGPTFLDRVRPLT